MALNLSVQYLPSLYHVLTSPPPLSLPSLPSLPPLTHCIDAGRGRGIVIQRVLEGGEHSAAEEEEE